MLCTCMLLTWLHKTAVSGKKKATGKQFNYEKENEETRKRINGSRKAEWLKWEKFNLSPEVRSYRKWSFILKDDGSDWEEIETNQSAEDETVFEGDEKPQACVVFLIPSEVIGTGATAMYVNMDQTRRAQTQMLVEGHQIDQLQQGAYMASAAVRRVCSVHACC